MNNYYFELKVSYDNQKIYINIYDLENNLLEAPYIDFSSINDRLRIKLNLLAVVSASKQEINKEKYFRYFSLPIYKLKNEKTFYYLIEKM